MPNLPLDRQLSRLLALAATNTVSQLANTTHNERGKSIDRDQLDKKQVRVELCKNRAHGDFACAVALEWAKPLAMSPLAIAEKIREEVLRLEENAAQPIVKSIDIAKPGFLNIVCTEYVWLETIASIRADEDRYGTNLMDDDSYIHRHKREVNVEFVSANPTGPLHLAHVRGAVIGDVVASILARAGHTVVREYYVNDGGTQIDALARAVYWRYCELFGKQPQDEDAPSSYPGDYLIKVAEVIAKTHEDTLLGQPESAWLRTLGTKAVAMMLDDIRDDLATLGIKQHYTHESHVVNSGRIERQVELLKSKGHIYEGELPPPKGQENEDWVPRRQLLFRTTHLGDDTDRPIQKHDGTWSYFAPDIVYHADKLSRGKDWLINVLGADHAGYEIRLRAAVEAVNPSARFDALFCQLVRLIKNGKPVKMSKREGNFVTLAEVVQAVKADAVRFSVAMRKTDTPHDIDVDLLTAQSRANPVFYVKYAHARCCSVLTKAQGMGYLLPKGNSLEGTIAVAYNHRGEDKDVVFHDLRLLLATWPMVFRRAAEQLAPHHIANYASELAAAFHTLWTLGIKNPEYRILPAMGMLPAEVDSMDLRLDDDPAHDRAPEARDRALEASSSATPASQVPGRATGYDRTQPNQTLFRLLVIDALRIVLASSLETLGMHPPNTM